MGSIYVEDGYITKGYIQTGISMNWGTGEIFVPKSELTLVQETPTVIYDLDLNLFRLVLKDLEDDSEGMPYPITHIHNTEVSLGGLTYARVIEILAPYTVTFEDYKYAVNLVGANSNVGDRVNVNQVSVRSANSAGMTSSPDIEYASFNNMVVIDAVNGYNIGEVAKVGTFQHPAKDATQATQIADYRGIKHNLYVIGNYTFIGADIRGYHVEGSGPLTTNVTVSSDCLCEDTTFENMRITDSTFDGHTVIKESIVCDSVNLSGFMSHCSLSGCSLSIADGGVLTIEDTFNDAGQITPIIFNGTGQRLMIQSCSGGFGIYGLGDTDNVFATMSPGIVLLDPNTITGGFVKAIGDGSLTDGITHQLVSSDNWHGAVIHNDLTCKHSISNSVWSALLSTYTITGSAGYELSNVPKPNAIADEVWDEILSTHTITGSAGDVLASDGVGGITPAQIAEAVWQDPNATGLIADVSFIKDIEGGRWKIINNQMIFYKDDNFTEVARFNLLGKTGLPTEDNVYQRVKV